MHLADDGTVLHVKRCTRERQRLHLRRRRDGLVGRHVSDCSFLPSIDDAVRDVDLGSIAGPDRTKDAAIDFDNQYCGQNLGCLIGNNAIVTKRFVIRAGFFQTLPVG